MNINQLPGIGPKTLKIFNKLGIFTVNDLLEYYPYRYNIYSFDNVLSEKENIIVSAIIETIPNIFYIKKNLNRMTFRARSESYIFSVTIFNRGFLKNNLQIGKQVVLVGKYDKKKNTFVASDIKFNIQNGDIEPVYHLTGTLTNNIIKKAMIGALKEKTIDLIPDIYQKKYRFNNKQESLKMIHFPKSSEEIKTASERLVYEELFNFSFKMNFLKKNIKQSGGISRNISKEDIQIFKNALPYKLTSDQDKALSEIIIDLESNKRMNRLLLGDVGSGKTVVSTGAIYINSLSGFQSALMAPTEILALQHFFSIKSVLDKFHISIGLITGSMTKKEKNALYDRVKDGDIDLLIGTHAILNDNVEFKNLGLVITDEQHRFGVNQRGKLENKGLKPDTLYLSATPIPRTYALTIYGDLDISIIKTKPSGRKEIITKLKKESEIKDVLLKIYDELKQNHQVYVVSPLVEQNDELDLTSVYELKNNLEKAFKGLVKTEIIHGKLKQAEKDSIMNEFKENKIKILISTTVIEVGIDVPNATMMVIFNAERFGLATLHQLRGRVGRSDIQSYCYLISNYDIDRLKVMEESNDGFYISEKDFELRGHGDLFGTKQHGDMNFKIANLKNDYEILVNAKNDAEDFIASKEYLNNEYYKELSENLIITN